MTKTIPTKRINTVTIKMVKRGSILYDVRQITTPSDAAGLGRKLLGDSDREQVIVTCLDTNNRPVFLNVVSIGCLNSSLIHSPYLISIYLISVETRLRKKRPEASLYSSTLAVMRRF